MVTVCPNGHMYRDNLLECPQCLAFRNEDSLLAAQPEFLRKTLKGDYALRVVKVGGGNKHTLLFTSYTRTFCGTELPVGKSKTSKPLLPTISYETWTAELMRRLCPGCRNAMIHTLEGVAR